LRQLAARGFGAGSCSVRSRCSAITSRITRAKSLRPVSSAPSATRAFVLLAAQRAGQSLERLFAGLLAGLDLVFQRSDAALERDRRLVAACEVHVLGVEGAGEGAAAFLQGHMRLAQLLEFGVASNALGFELGRAQLHGVARQCDLMDAAIIIADFVGTGDEMLTRLAEQPFGRGDARLQRFVADALAIALVLVALVAFVERGREPRTLGVGFGEVRLDVARAARLVSVSESLRGRRAASVTLVSRQACSARFSSSAISRRWRALLMLASRTTVRFSAAIRRSSGRWPSSRSALLSPTSWTRRLSNSPICARRAATSMAFALGRGLALFQVGHLVTQLA
jgi:hypothetical protein